MESIEQLARDVDIAQDRLELAKRRLLAALGAPVSGTGSQRRIAPSRQQPRQNGSSLPASQQVLKAIEGDPDGVTRKQLIDAIGKPAAIHSALKKHQKAGLIVSKDGRWVAKKKGPRP